MLWPMAGVGSSSLGLVAVSVLDVDRPLCGSSPRRVDWSDCRLDWWRHAFTSQQWNPDCPQKPINRDKVTASLEGIGCVDSKFDRRWQSFYFSSSLSSQKVVLYKSRTSEGFPVFFQQCSVHIHLSSIHPFIHPSCMGEIRSLRR